MGYIGKRPTDIPLDATDIPNLDASKITTGTLDNARITLDAAEIPNLDTAKITTGTMADARISAGSVTQHVTAVDLVPLKQDIATLALHSAIADNKTAYNLPNFFIDQFEDDTGILTETDVDRSSSEYVSSISGAGYAFVSDSDTSLLIHSNTTNGSTTFADSSSGNHTVTVRSGTTHSTVKKKIGSSSMLNTRSTGITFADHADFDFGTGAFTIEAWINIAAATSDTMYIFGKAGGSNTDCRLAIAANTGKVWVDEQVSNSDSNIYSTNSVCDGEWHHIAVSRTSGGTTNLWVDGADNQTGGTNRNCDNGNTLGIGCAGNNTTGGAVGYTDEVRVSKGVSRYSGSTFTPPTEVMITSATGTLISNAQTASSATTKLSGVFLYKDNAGTATLGTDLKIYLSANNGTNFTEIPSYGTVSPLFSTGIKMIRMPETTVTSGSQIKLKAVWANQASGSKETQLHGWAVNY